MGICKIPSHLLGALLVSERALDGEGAAARGRGRGGGRRRRLLLGGAEGGRQEASAGESKSHLVESFFFLQRQRGKKKVVLIFLCTRKRRKKKKEKGQKNKLSFAPEALFLLSVLLIREDRAWRVLSTPQRALRAKKTALSRDPPLKDFCFASVALSRIERTAASLFKERESKKNGDAAHLQQQVAPPGDQIPRAVYDPRGAAGQGESEEEERRERGKRN